MAEEAKPKLTLEFVKLCDPTNNFVFRAIAYDSTSEYVCEMNLLEAVRRKHFQPVEEKQMDGDDSDDISSEYFVKLMGKSIKCVVENQTFQVKNETLGGELSKFRGARIIFRDDHLFTDFALLLPVDVFTVKLVRCLENTEELCLRLLNENRQLRKMVRESRSRTIYCDPSKIEESHWKIYYNWEELIDMKNPVIDDQLWKYMIQHKLGNFQEDLTVKFDGFYEAANEVAYFARKSCGFLVLRRDMDSWFRVVELGGKFMLIGSLHLSDCGCDRKITEQFFKNEMLEKDMLIAHINMDGNFISNYSLVNLTIFSDTGLGVHEEKERQRELKEINAAVGRHTGQAARRFRVRAAATFKREMYRGEQIVVKYRFAISDGKITINISNTDQHFPQYPKIMSQIRNVSVSLFKH